MAVLAEGQRQVVQLSKQVVTVARSVSVGEESSCRSLVAAKRGATPAPIPSLERLPRQKSVQKSLRVRRSSGPVREPDLSRVPYVRNGPGRKTLRRLRATVPRAIPACRVRLGHRWSDRPENRTHEIRNNSKAPNANRTDFVAFSMSVFGNCFGFRASDLAFGIHRFSRDTCLVLLNGDFYVGKGAGTDKMHKAFGGSGLCED